MKKSQKKSTIKIAADSALNRDKNEGYGILLHPSTSYHDSISLVNTIESTAYHEAAHVFAALIFGIKFKYVTIIPDECSLGSVRDIKSCCSIFDYVTYLMAGEAIENIKYGEDEYRLATLSDGIDALDAFEEFSGTDEGAYEFRGDCLERATSLIKANLKLVEAITRKLLREKTLTYRKCQNLLSAYFRGEL